MNNLTNLSATMFKQSITQPVLTLVTPELAQQYLSTIELNRGLNKGHIKRLQSDIENDRWVVTHQGIAFDSNGRMVDGEHRCRAIVAANKAVYMFVTHGVSRDSSIVAIDQGKARTGGQGLAMQGITQSAFKAAVCRQLCVLYRPDMTYTGTITNADTVNTYKKFQESIDLFAGTSYFTAAYYAPLIVWHQEDPQASEKFNEAVRTGVMCENTLAALKKKLETRKSEGGSKSVVTLLSTVSAIESVLTGKNVSKVRINLASYKSFVKRFDLPFNTSLGSYACSD